jgi:hypothetical protein
MEIVVLISTFFFCFIIWMIINSQCIGFEKIKSNQIKNIQRFDLDLKSFLTQ